MSKSLIAQGILCIALAASLPALQAINGLGVAEPEPGPAQQRLAGTERVEPIPPVFSEAMKLEEISSPDDYCPFGA